MTQEKMQLLTVDLSSRLPYGVRLHIEYELGESCDIKLMTIGASRTGKLYVNNFCVGNGHDFNAIVKPYLRPMSSMTEEEVKECDKFSTPIQVGMEAHNLFDSIGYVDWLNRHHFDYRHLISKGLALEAPDGMYGKEDKK